MTSVFNFSTIGLESRDKRVYEALVASPQSSLRKIASDTGINRGSVYESIKKLAEQGLVGSIEVGKQRRYTATDPNAIVEIIKERREELVKAERQAASYISTLEQTPGELTSIPFATFYEDHEGVAAILRDVIATCRSRNGKAYRVISTKRVREFMYHNFPNFTQRRITEGISVQVIAVGKGGSHDNLSERKWFDAARGEAPNCYTLIYGDKTAFISLNEANVLSGIVIDNEGVAHLQKELFDRLWQAL